MRFRRDTGGRTVIVGRGRGYTYRRKGGILVGRQMVYLWEGGRDNRGRGEILVIYWMEEGILEGRREVNW